MSRVRVGDTAGNMSGSTSNFAAILNQDLSGQPAGAVVINSPASALVNGSIAFELIFSPTSTMWSQVQSATVCIFEANTSAGLLSLQYQAHGNWYVILNGVNILRTLDTDDGESGTFRNNLSQSGLTNDYMIIIFGYIYATNQIFIQISNNGSSTFLSSNLAGVTGTNPIANNYLTPITSISAITVGSKINTTLPLAAKWKRFKAFNSASFSGTTPETVLIIGDSTDVSLQYSPGSSACASTSSHIFTPTEAATFTQPIIRNQAIGGHTASLQQSIFTANVAQYRNIQYVVIGTGINDANAGNTGQQIFSATQTLINTIKSNLPGAKIIIRQTNPCAAFLGGGKASELASYNAIILDGHSFTGVDAVASSHYAVMSDGLNNLSTIYDSGDGVHPKDAGRACVASSVRGALSSLGLTTYDKSTAPGSKVIVFTGDSITAGAGLNTGVNDFSSVAIASLNNPWQWIGGGIGANNFATYNVGVSGSTAADKITADRAAVDPKLTSAYKNIVVFFAGANDLYLGANIATTISNVDTAISLYPPSTTIGVVTPLPRTYPGTPISFETDRLTLRSYILSKYGSNAIDVGGDTIMGNVSTCSNVTYYQDLVHPTAVGDAIIAAIVATWINSVAP